MRSTVRRPLLTTIILLALLAGCSPSPEGLGRVTPVRKMGTPIPLVTVGLVPEAARNATPLAPPTPGEDAENTPTPPALASPTPQDITIPAPDLQGGTPTPRPAPTPESADADEDEEVDTEALVQQGQEVYVQNCAACHQQDGSGVQGQFPALAGSPFVTGDPQPVLQTVVHGRGGMPSFGNQLDDDQIAAVVSYIRQAWDNEADAVEPEQVQQVR
jgi:cytochrome c6